MNAGILIAQQSAAVEQAAVEQAAVEQVAEFGKHRPIGVGVSKEKRIFVTFPKTPENYDYGLAEIVNGQRHPYPSADWNRWDSTKPTERFMNVQALFVDRNNDLWVLDPGNPGEEGTIPEGIKLMHISLADNKIVTIYRFKDLPRQKTALNDVQVDTDNQVAYLSDPKRAAIVVLDLKTGKSRSVLEGDKSTTADPDFVLKLDGKEVRDKAGKPFSSNVNGIALTTDFQYLYYRPITQTKLYRLATEHLRNPTLSAAELSAKVEVAAETGVSHGMIADRNGNVYLTDSPAKAVRYLTPSRELKTLARDSRFSWPDSFSIGPDGYLYMTDAQINRGAKFNNGQDKTDYPFRLYRMKLPD
ncbi:MAG: gluconolactonase [Spirosoma sp.]|nr:gluconolactonase [Spirosoma sp.]